MRQKFQKWLRGTAFLLVLVICLVIVGEILTPKFLEDQPWQSTTSYTGFYKMKKNTIDVICLGSSRAFTTFDPQYLYDQYGIRSYNLSGEQQNMMISYYWLKEALRYQKPKVVVLHASYIFRRKNRPVLFSSESCVRKAFNWMRLSPVKIEAIQTLCKLVPTQSALSYYIPFLNYHTRWEELSEDDYRLTAMDDYRVLKGWEPLNSYVDKEYTPFRETDSDKVAKPEPLMEEFSDKIIDLCKENDIQVLLYETPATTRSVARHNFEVQYARKHQVRFIDYNLESLYEELGFQYEENATDTAHANVRGAEKITAHLGRILKEEYQVPAVEDEQWSSTSEGYQQVVRDFELLHMTDTQEYLTTLQEGRYTIFLASMGDAKGALDEETAGKLRALGMHCGFMDVEDVECHYAAVVSQGELVAEKMKSGKASDSGSIRENRVMFDISSNANACSILIDGEELALQNYGLNLVVYDNDRRFVIDRVSIDTTDENLTLHRE